MKIGIINNAANYLNFNINFGRYLNRHNYDVQFLNCDKYIKNQLTKYNLKVVDYTRTNRQIEKPYSENSTIVKYYKRLLNLSNTGKLINNLNLEYQNAYNYLESSNFDYVLILNGTFHVETKACRNLGIKCFFFEHGYFPNSIQMDPNGVNSDASFSKLTLREFLNFRYPTSTFNPLIDFKLIKTPQSKIVRYLTRLSDSKYNKNMINFFLKKINQETADKRFREFPEEILDFDHLKPYIFFPLQVNSDTQIILNSPYKSMYEAIEKVLSVLKSTGYNIVIKEHPLEVEPVDYSKFIDKKQVFLTRKANLEQLIEHSEFVVNINSSVGLQSIAKYKKVLLLGSSFYSNSPGSINLTAAHPTLKGSIDSINVDKKEIDRYIDHFRTNIFIKGHFYKPDVAFFERIRNRMT